MKIRTAIKGLPEEFNHLIFVQLNLAFIAIFYFIKNIINAEVAICLAFHRNSSLSKAGSCWRKLVPASDYYDYNILFGSEGIFQTGVPAAYTDYIGCPDSSVI
jgi:hypothetical protein